MKTANSSMLCNIPHLLNLSVSICKKIKQSYILVMIIAASSSPAKQFPLLLKKETIEIQFGNMSGFRIQFGET